MGGTPSQHSPVSVTDCANDKLAKPRMVLPDQGTCGNTGTRPRRKSKVTPPQDRRQKWRKNYMMMSLPCQDDDVIKLSSLKREDFHSFTQSLHRQSGKQLKHDQRKTRLLKLLKNCAESIEGIASKSYVESMKSCASSDTSSSYNSNYDSSQDLIILEDKAEVPTSGSADLEACGWKARTALPKSDSKNLSEIILRNNVQDENLFSQLGSGDVSYCSVDNQSKRYGAPKLRLANSFCSSYVEDSDFSYTKSEEDISTNKTSASKRCMATGPVFNRNSRYSRLNEDDYRDLVSNGKSTAFLSHHEDDLSLYYDDEFDTEKSPLGAPLHDSDLEAAICNEYASLLHTANGGNLYNHTQSINSTDAHSNFSSDFENIFPTSLSLHADHVDSVDRGEVSNSEEITDLDRSVPNYSDIPASTKKDYQLTFAQTESLYSDARSSCGYVSSDGSSEDEGFQQVLRNRNRKVKQAPAAACNQIPKPPRALPRQRPQRDAVQLSTKKVSFSDELAVVDENDKTHAEKMEVIGNSTTWQQMKQNYTTWGQIKGHGAATDSKKSKSVPDIRTQSEPLPDVSAANRDEDVDGKRYSLTLWELYKRTHSMSLGVDEGELTTPEAFKDPTQSEITLNKTKRDRAKQELTQSINELLDDALLGPDRKNSKKVTKTSATTFDLPDLSFLRHKKDSLSEHNWWKEIFDQPSFCTAGVSRTSSLRTCSQCERKHSNDHHVILFQGSRPAQYKMCELSILDQLISPSSHPCQQCTKDQCVREKLCDLSSGIATGSSGVTPREPNSWQHIADFLKRRQKHTDTNSRGSLNSTVSDQQLLDIVACIETADSLVKQQQQQTNSTVQQQPPQSEDLLMQIWRLVSSLECVLSIGLKSHKLTAVAMGKIRTRVSIWDIVEESSASAGKLTNTFSQIILDINRYQLKDTSLKFCLFVVGVLNYQCLDFWLSILTHNRPLMDKYYNDDSYLRSKVIADRKLHTEMIQALQPLSLFHWDIDYSNMILACSTLPDKTDELSKGAAYHHRQTSMITAHHAKANPILGKMPKYYSANNIRQAVLI